MPKPEVYFSVDIESDGPIPGIHSMLSFGCVAFDESGQEIGAFEKNLEQLPEATTNPDTMEWWATQEEAWEYARRNTVPAEQAMEEFIEWVDSFSGLPVMVCFPAGYDFTFMYWYMMRFVGRSPFSFSALDIKTFAMATLGLKYRGSSKRNWPREWFKGNPKHSHKAIEDARGQGMSFMKMLKYNKDRIARTAYTKRDRRTKFD